MPTRVPFLFFVAAGSVVAAKGPLTSSLVFDPTNPAPFTTFVTTVITTVTSPLLPTTITPSSPESTTTLFVPLSPVTTTTTIYTDSPLSSSPHPSTDTNNAPMSSGSPSPLPTNHGNGSITRNPGALAGLIIGVCVFVAGLLAFAWFTIQRHRNQELENQALEPPEIGPYRRSASVRGMLRHSANGRSGIDDDFDPEIQSYIGPEVRSLPSDQAILPSLSGILGGRQSQEHQTDFDVGYLVGDPTAASSGGRSSHGNGTVITRTSSPTHATSSRNTSPTISRQNPNLTRLSTDRPSAWQPSRSEAPTRRASIDNGSTYHPPRVNSDPIVFPDTPHLMSIYPRRQSQSSEAPRPDAFPPSILVYNPPPAPPSSLLRPPSANQVPTLQTLQQLQPPTVHLSPPFVNEPHASPAPSILSVTEGLLSTPPNHPTGSLSSLRDDLDYTRKLGVVSPLRDSMVEVDSDSEMHPHRDSTQ